MPSYGATGMLSVSYMTCTVCADGSGVVIAQEFTSKPGRRTVPQASLVLLIVIIIILPYLFLSPNETLSHRKTPIELADVRLLNKYVKIKPLAM